MPELGVLEVHNTVRHHSYPGESDSRIVVPGISPSEIDQSHLVANLVANIEQHLTMR
jgi:hypothetical protein